MPGLADVPAHITHCSWRALIIPGAHCSCREGDGLGKITRIAASHSGIALQAGLQANRDAACGGRVSRRRPTGFPAVITRKINEARSSANDCGSDDPHYRAAFGFPVLPTPMNLNRENVLMQDLIII